GALGKVPTRSCGKVGREPGNLAAIWRWYVRLPARAASRKPFGGGVPDDSAAGRRPTLSVTSYGPPPSSFWWSGLTRSQAPSAVLADKSSPGFGAGRDRDTFMR